MTDYYQKILNRVYHLIEDGIDNDIKIDLSSMRDMIKFLDKYKMKERPLIYMSDSGVFEIFVGKEFFIRFRDGKTYTRLFYKKYHENTLTSFLLCYNLTHHFEGDIIASLAQRESTALTQQGS